MKQGNEQKPSAERIARRHFLKLGMAAAGALVVPGAAFAYDDWIRITPEKLEPRTHAPSTHTQTARLIPPTSRYYGRAQVARELSLYNVHTGESLNTAYFEDGRYVPGALHEVNYLFRDFRANQVKEIDPQLLDVLYDIRRELGTNRRISLVSGYRSPATNAWLAQFSEGVARHSMHMEGKASDIHIQGVQLADLQRAALSLGAGGVGYYPRSGFVHVDTGRVRRW